MRTTSVISLKALIILAAFILPLSACGNNSSTSELFSDETQSIAGNVSISGSSTVEPISVRVAELFSDIESGVNVSVDGPGTGDGFKLFCEGETDISGASRQIKVSEAEDCSANRIEWIELQVAIDGIAVMTNNDNPLDCVSFADIYALVGPESQGIGNWAEGQNLADQLGTSTKLPDLKLDVFGPGAESGTFDSFIELVLEDIADERGEDVSTRVDYNANANDNVILQGITSKSGSFGWVGFAYAVNAENVKLLRVDGSDGCVPANPDTIVNGEYPISRPLYIYVNADEAASNSALRAYVDYYVLEGLDVAVSEVGYVSLTEESKQKTRNEWNSRVSG